MKPQKASLRTLDSISEQHAGMGLPKPRHPLVSTFKFEDVDYSKTTVTTPFVLSFYCVAIKKNFTGKLKYGQRYYDFNEGMMSFIAPLQLLSLEEGEQATEGYCLVFHPDLIQGHPLAKKLDQYGFFSYSLSEALHLSEAEETLIETLMEQINTELNHNIDPFSQDIIVSQIELLLNYSHRFYKRQFITRGTAGKQEILVQLEGVLKNLFLPPNIALHGLPTVQQLAAQMNFSAGYLSDMLRSLTGHGAQYHLHQKLIGQAKEALSTTALSVSEIAYALGFGQPQAFSKFFKAKTQVSPGAFRDSFN